MPEQQDIKTSKKLNPVWRAMLELGFIIFLFYSNLLMGEYNHSGQGHKNGLLWALNDIFTIANLTIAIGLGLVGHLVFEFLRRRL
jgi:uncharacterized protein with PQ loop repeat